MSAAERARRGCDGRPAALAAGALTFGAQPQPAYDVILRPTAETDPLCRLQNRPDVRPICSRCDNPQNSHARRIVTIARGFAGELAQPRTKQNDRVVVTRKPMY